MEKRTLFAAVLVVVLGLGAFAALRAPDKGERQGPKARPVAALKAADITKLEIVTQKDEKTTLEKKDGAWRITSPSDWRADSAVVKSLLDGIEKLSFGDTVTESAAKHADLGVADKGSTHLTITASTGAADILLGKPIGGFTMLRVPGKNDVWQASNLYPYLANKAPKEWRDHAIIDMPDKDVQTLKVEVPNGARIVLERTTATGDDAKPVGTWKITDSTMDAPKNADTIDVSQPDTVAKAMQALRAADFPDGKSAKDAGLEPPALIVTETGKGKTEALELSAPQGDDVYVRKVGEPTIYMVKKYGVDRLTYKPIDYRDKTLLKLKADELTKIRIAQGKDELVLTPKAGKWQTATGVTDEGKAKALLGGVDGLMGSSFLTDKTVKTELDHPRATITVEPKAGGKLVVAVGGMTKDGDDYYVSRDGGKTVLLVKKFAIDRLLKKPADMVPSPKPPATPPGHPMVPNGMKMPSR